MAELESAVGELEEGWVSFETEAANFGDKRLDKRYAQVLGQMSKMPSAALTQSSECLAELLGAYRFIDNAKVTVEKILEPHREQTAQRAALTDTVLLVQDTTYLNFSDREKCEELKPFRPGHLSKALWLHTTLCLRPNGLPLGIVDAQFTTGNEMGSGADSRRPITEKLSYRWIKAVERCRDLFPSNVRKIWVCDREGDMYELFDTVSAATDDFVVRLKYFREIEEPPFDMRHALRDAKAQGCLTISIAETRTRQKRTAHLEVKYVPLTITVPQYKSAHVSSKCISASLVEAKEIDAPEGEEPLHWMIVTSLNVSSLPDAMEILAIYQRRWSIEELFKILKSGCRVEKAQFQNSTRLSKYMSLSLIVAWRIYLLVHLNRLDPNAAADTVVTQAEKATLQALADFRRHRQKKQRRVVIKTVRQALTEIARLGGYLDRKNDPYPGITVFWKGTVALAFSTISFLAQRHTANA